RVCFAARLSQSTVIVRELFVDALNNLFHFGQSPLSPFLARLQNAVDRLIESCIQHNDLYQDDQHMKQQGAIRYKLNRVFRKAERQRHDDILSWDFDVSDTNLGSFIKLES